MKVRHLPSHLPDGLYEPVIGIGFVAMVTAALATAAYGIAVVVAMFF